MLRSLACLQWLAWRLLAASWKLSSTALQCGARASWSAPKSRHAGNLLLCAPRAVKQNHSRACFCPSCRHMAVVGLRLCWKGPGASYYYFIQLVHPFVPLVQLRGVDLGPSPPNIVAVKRLEPPGSGGRSSGGGDGAAHHFGSGHDGSSSSGSGGVGVQEELSFDCSFAWSSKMEGKSGTSAAGVLKWVAALGAVHAVHSMDA